MNRGSIALAVAHETLGDASMRPRFMNRGSLFVLDVAQGRPKYPCFNEAPIHESGKFGGTSGTSGKPGARHESGSQGMADARSASMRPRFMNRGSVRTCGRMGRCQCSGSASMRPRFMNRGSERSAWIGIRPLGQAAASMRPRFMNRGSYRVRGVEHGHRPKYRFNEAPIHESGKLPSCTVRPTLVTRSPHCFNEAPIHESGKSTDCLATRSSPAKPASMRPRFMNRGSDDQSSVLTRRVSHVASMRPRFMNRGSPRIGPSRFRSPRPSRFNEAPIHESGKS